MSCKRIFQMSVLVVLLLLLLVLPVRWAEAQVGELLTRVPADANAVLVINVESMLNTKLAESQFCRNQTSFTLVTKC